MKNQALLVICFGIFFLLTCCKNAPEVQVGCYYLSASGNDVNPGTKEKPWQTVTKVNTLDLSPGDTLFLEGGSVFPGTIKLDSLDSGTEGKEVTIKSFGTGKATIDGGLSAGIEVNACDYFNVEDLMLTGAGRKDGNITDGVFIAGSDHLRIDRLEISGFQHSGLHVYKCNDVQITNVHSHDNGFAGILVDGNTAYDPLNFDNEDIYIGYCLTENNPGDPTVLNNHSGSGILASSVNRGVIEYCESFNNGWDMQWTGNGPVGIWIWDCNDFKIQYCISHDNKTNPVAKDGGGFDLDGGVSNSVIQYCLSYNNQGGGYGLFEFGAGKPWENNTLRYCISLNDGSLNGGSVAIWRGSPEMTMRNCDIYNNTFYNSTQRGYSLTIENNATGFRFFSNIFVFKEAFLIPGARLVSELFQGNCYFNLSGDRSIAGFKDLGEWAAITSNEMLDGRMAGFYADPRLVDPSGFLPSGTVKLNKDDLMAFSLKSGSPLIGRGLDLEQLINIDPGATDIAGTDLSTDTVFDIGALKYRK
jgi:hypothetical protein